MGRYIIAHTSLGDDALLFKQLKGEEKLSTLYRFEIELISEKKDVDIKSLRGKSITIEINTPGNPSAEKRYLNGIINEGIVCDFHDPYRYKYKFIVQPKLSILKNSKGCKIWQNKAPLDIIKEILNKYSVKFESKLNGTYQQLEYCTQYRESDFNFISRLMEHEGIYYYFTHSASDHTLILADSPQSHEALSGYSALEYYPGYPTPRNSEKLYLYDWNVSYSLAPKVYSTNDYNFLQPRAQLLETQQNPDSTVPDSTIYEWPGNYTAAAQGKSYIQALQQSYTAHCHYINAQSIETGIAPGHTFTLSKAPRDEDNGDYLIVSADYELSESGYYGGDPDSEFKIETHFTAIPAKVNWRAPCITPWPVAYIETAEITGSSGKEIWTNEYAQVKVKFHWDQESAKDDKSSCWVRCSSTWASTKFGAIQIPRVGDDVFVSFINGNPDRPLVIGSAFNKENMPPWTLPSEATKIGFMSRSIQGGKDNTSYLFIDDAQNKESFAIHAEKDMAISVENDQTIAIDGSRTTEIKKKQTDTITEDATFSYKAKRDTTVEQQETAVFKNKQKTTVTNGKEVDITSGGLKYTVKDDYQADISGNKKETVSGNKEETVSGNKKESISGNKEESVSGNKKATISGNDEGSITGNWKKTVTGSAEIKATSSLKLSATSTSELKGTASVTISGTMIKIG
ncbi:MAG: type VI secretion system tip protein VgrG [Enterobacteriaceae bacterium]|jgi:type VI secretion system secreted protein VgrG|nr:type VI secretion system tip protein VgrG [Enterobacteriaceae bacterium]